MTDMPDRIWAIPIDPEYIHTGTYADVTRVTRNPPNDMARRYIAEDGETIKGLVEAAKACVHSSPPHPAHEALEAALRKFTGEG